jgi:hypothetical protein
MAIKHFLGLALLAGGAACASTAAPQGQLAASQAAIRAATELGASDVPKAALHLQMAQENTQKAEKLISQGENEQAQMVLMRAESDAELALNLAKESKAQKEAQIAMDKIKDVKAKAE